MGTEFSDSLAQRTRLESPKSVSPGESEVPLNGQVRVTSGDLMFGGLHHHHHHHHHILMDQLVGQPCGEFRPMSPTPDSTGKPFGRTGRPLGLRIVYMSKGLRVDEVIKTEVMDKKRRRSGGSIPPFPHALTFTFESPRKCLVGRRCWEFLTKDTPWRCGLRLLESFDS